MNTVRPTKPCIPHLCKLSLFVGMWKFSLYICMWICLCTQTSAFTFLFDFFWNCFYYCVCMVVLPTVCICALLGCITSESQRTVTVRSPGTGVTVMISFGCIGNWTWVLWKFLITEPLIQPLPFIVYLESIHLPLEMAY